MKISRISNFGNFGVYVDDIDMNNITEDEWTELGKLFVKELLVIFRNIKIDKTQYLDWMPKWGPLKSNIRMQFYKKYGKGFDSRDSSTWDSVSEEDRRWLEIRSAQLEESGDGRFLTRVYGRKDAEGRSLGYFSHGEVEWHANESSSLLFSPGVALLGWEMMENSATCFVQTVDLYESLDESFRAELDEMVLVHEYNPGRLNENELTDSTLAYHMKLAFCPIDGTETPLVITAPNGRKGLRYTVNTRARIKNASDNETQKIFDRLDKLVFDEKWIHNHWYEKDRSDLLCFDNSVTLHKRIGGHEDRKAFRQQFDLSPLLDNPWEPWKHQPKYHEIYKEDITQLINLTGGDLAARFKLPR
jgi:alpha-ketoglutarate-dependent taurine dioxygenase